MIGENSTLRSQAKGYLFEIVITELLRKNDFSEVRVENEPYERVRKSRQYFVEFKGRGCWHQIDCPCDYSKLIPFSYPLRLLGEVKFHKKPLDKKYIREYIGVIKDIQENYFVADSVNLKDLCSRKMEIGVYFSASGFQEEAEKLAYAHGIKTISYVNTYLIENIKNLIIEFERNYLSVRWIGYENWPEFRRAFEEALITGDYRGLSTYRHYLSQGYNEIIELLRGAIFNIKTSFIATTVTGVFIHFVGDADFPEHLFRNTDEGNCRVFYNYDNFGKRYFWLELSEDEQRRHFYFTPPESLDYAAIFGKEKALLEKERLFKTLNICIKLNGISRNLTLKLDEDWKDAVLKEQ